MLLEKIGEISVVSLLICLNFKHFFCILRHSTKKARENIYG